MTAEPVNSIPEPERAIPKSAPRAALDEIRPTLLANPGSTYRFSTEATKNQGRNLTTGVKSGTLKPEHGTITVAIRKNGKTNDNGEDLYDLYAVYTAE